MKATHTLDLYLWKYLIPNLGDNIFKWRILSIFSIYYISIFHLPRKFIKHYFKGYGHPVTVDTKKIILGNPEVHELLLADISKSMVQKKEYNMLPIPQIFVTNPNYRYSLGSFGINYTLKDEILHLKINSNYHFTLNPDRITRYLHNWLYRLKLEGRARDFVIKGDEWVVSLSEISSFRKIQQIKKLDFNRLYI